MGMKCAVIKLDVRGDLDIKARCTPVEIIDALQRLEDETNARWSIVGDTVVPLAEDTLRDAAIATFTWANELASWLSLADWDAWRTLLAGERCCEPTIKVLEWLAKTDWKPDEKNRLQILLDDAG